MTDVVTRIAGSGSFLPGRVLTNDELAKRVDTSDAWIRERTGIAQRHIASDGETTASLSEAAARRALDDAGLTAADIDLIVVATTTPDLVFPSTATLIQARIGMEQGAAFDVQAVCSGFVYALSVADALLRTGQHRRALVIGAETMSRILNWDDRATCVLFGDGAGAWVLEAVEGKAGQGVLGCYLRSDGRLKDLLHTTGGPSSTQSSGYLVMQGNAVFKHAVVNISEAMTTLMAQHGFSGDDIDWFVPHQANQRILEAVAKRLGIAPGKVVSTVALHGNTSAASVPLAFDVAVKDGRIKRGDLCLLEALGGGLTWGSALVRY
ncbi:MULTISPECIES: beta-ketoacyl-ACP synthase III [Hyphobacterium]|uniref:Beta-ketoacyl-[acyl-carrier-protein] synthase III n=1 Tax=Hyphobacterium vulgare TaxID=1736751 RepID=A0ABV6ZTC6_9PROT